MKSAINWTGWTKRDEVEISTCLWVNSTFEDGCKARLGMMESMECVIVWKMIEGKMWMELDSLSLGVGVVC